MRWNFKQPKKARRIFALLPTKLKDGSWLWLEECWRANWDGAANGWGADYYAHPPPLYVLIAAGERDERGNDLQKATPNE